MKQDTVIPLGYAFLCGHDHITDNPYKCPLCDSEVMPLWSALNREQEREETMLEVHG